MKIFRNQKGFSATEMIMVGVVLVVIVGAGYFVWNRNKSTDSTASQTTSEPATASDVKTAPEIKTSSDLDEAEKLLDATDPESSNESDSSSLDSELSSF